MAGGVDGISQEWWDRWWAEDWSWEGLAKKPWAGWVVPAPGAEPVPDEARTRGERLNLTDRFGPDAQPATLQDYWRDQETSLETGPDGVSFTRLHLPFEWQDGTPTGKADWPSNALNALIENRLNHVDDRAFEEKQASQVDWRAQFQGIVFHDFSLDALELIPRSQSERQQIAIHCRDCAFTGYARFIKAAFTDEARFNYTAFAGPAYFDEAAFAGDAGFRNTAFADGASFNEAAFAGLALFHEATFANLAVFSEAAFASLAYFNEATFANLAMFSMASFAYEISFNKATFGGYAAFKKATFAGDASFNEAAFPGYTVFDEAAFAGTASFDDVAFAGPASFSEAAFAGHASFARAVFAGAAQFTGKSTSVTADRIAGKLTSDSESSDFEIDFPQQATWTAQRSFPNANFEETVFLGDAKFDNRDFHSQTSFKHTVFLRPAAFHDSKLHRGITFRNTYLAAGLVRDRAFPKEIPAEYDKSFNAGLDRLVTCAERAAEIKNEDTTEYEPWKTRFTNDRAKEEAEFLALKRFGQPFRHKKREALKGLGLLKRLNVFGKDRKIALAPVKDWQAEGIEERAKYFGELEDCYRTLKHLMEDRRDRHEEGRFHKLELRARRKRRRPAVNISEQWLSHLYGWSADYGNSVLLPIVWLLVGSFVLAGVYALMGTTGPAHFGRDLFAPYSAADWGETLSYSFSRVFPFGGWGDPDPCSMIGQMLAADGVGLDTPCSQIEGRVDRQFVGGTPIALKALTTFQSIAAIILIFLAGLAARRKFQIN